MVAGIAVAEAGLPAMVSDPFVEALTKLEAQRSAYLYSETGRLPTMATYTTPMGVEPIPWYRRRINQQAGYIGAMCTHQVIPGNDAYMIRVLGESTADSDMPFLPLDDVSRTGEVIAAVDPRKDVDDLTRESPWWSATARGAVARLNGAIWGSEWFAGKTPDQVSTLQLGNGYTKNDLVIVGNGAVGGALVDMLRDQGHAISNEQIVGKNTNQHVLRGLGKGSILLTASPVSGQIRSSQLQEGSILVDMGCSRLGKERCGNAHPELLERPDITVTPPKGLESVGHATAGYLWLHSLEAMRIGRLPNQDLTPLGRLALAA